MPRLWLQPDGRTRTPRHWERRERLINSVSVQGIVLDYSEDISPEWRFRGRQDFVAANDVACRNLCRLDAQCAHEFLRRQKNRGDISKRQRETEARPSRLSSAGPSVLKPETPARTTFSCIANMPLCSWNASKRSEAALRESTRVSATIAPPSFLVSRAGLLGLPGRPDRRLKNGLRPGRHKRKVG
jgi:hypothetical protein